MSGGMGQLAPVEICEYLGMRPTWVDGSVVGGSVWEFMLQHATAAIIAGFVDIVVLSTGRRLAAISNGATAPPIS